MKIFRKNGIAYAVAIAVLLCGSLRSSGFKVKAELINGQIQIRLWMKLRTSIRGSRVYEVCYRFFLFTEVVELGCHRFFARNQSDGENHVLFAFAEGDEQQLAEFRIFAQTKRLEGANVADIAFEDYSGPIMSLDAFLHCFIADQLNKGIPALPRIDRKQDKTLEKHDMMLEKQDATISKLDETRVDIVSEIRASRGEITAKLGENREAIIGEIGEQKMTLDDRFKRIESDISKLKAKVGI